MSFRLSTFFRTFIRLAGLLAVLAAILPASWAAAPPAERWLPAETLGYLTIPSVAASRSAWSNQPPAAFWRDPAMQPFRRRFTENMEAELLAPLAALTGLHADRLLDHAEGQVTLVFLPG